MPTVWKRARSDAQKEQRKAALLHAATRMIEAHPIEKISLNTIAREANISKANVYRYFESREALFLQLTLEAFADWRDATIRRLERLAGTNDAEAVATAIASTTMEHETFARLAAVLSTVLERNVSTDVIAEFKLAFVGATADLLSALRDAIPHLTDEDATFLLQVTYFQIVGMWPAAHPPPAVQAALQRPELVHACVDFERSLQKTIVTTIAGLRR